MEKSHSITKTPLICLKAFEELWDNLKIEKMARKKK